MTITPPLPRMDGAPRRLGPAPVMLADARAAFVTLVAPSLRDGAVAQLHALEAYLGHPAPLLAYTPLTGETWLRSLPAREQESARTLLRYFRAYLREHGWLDAARPINQFD